MGNEVLIRRMNGMVKNLMAGIEMIGVEIDQKKNQVVNVDLEQSADDEGTKCSALQHQLLRMPPRLALINCIHHCT